MSYLIEGYLQRREKPEMYMNTFVDSKTHHTVKFEILADISNAYRNSNFVWNDSRDVAEKLCGVQKFNIAEERLFEPTREDLTRKFTEDKFYQTVDGQLRVWRETRFPTPWIYIFSTGTLEKVFEFDGNKFYEDFEVHPSGKKSTWGLLLPIIYAQRTHGKVEMIYDPNDGTIHASVPMNVTNFKGHSHGFHIGFSKPKRLTGSSIARLSVKKELPNT